MFQVMFMVVVLCFFLFYGFDFASGERTLFTGFPEHVQGVLFGDEGTELLKPFSLRVEDGELVIHRR